ncbi:MAG: hypothetical protein KDC84_07180 [Crocinitomicaceae bacterium]|nr:hypothetical protein [Crocinitomicaceae bacterium]
MRKNKLNFINGILAICIAFGLFSCSQEEEVSKEKESNKEEQPKTPDLHLREMMRFMFNDMTVNREKILNGDQEMHFSFDYTTMPLAEATTPENKGKDSYEANMAKFIDLQKQLAESRDNLKRAHLFNDMRETCISCHQEYCIGPLRKIDKILIIPNDILAGEQFQ